MTEMSHKSGDQWPATFTGSLEASDLFVNWMFLPLTFCFILHLITIFKRDKALTRQPASEAPSLK